MHRDEPLLTPVTVGGLRLNNRVVMSPMTRARAGAAMVPNALMAEYYRQRAGAGLLVTEGTFVSEQAIGWVNAPGIYTDVQQHAWEQVTAAVHAVGGRIFLQLWHCGRASHSSFRADASRGVAPSAVPIRAPSIHAPVGKVPHEIPRALETDEIPRVVQDYCRAAGRAMAAGFDGVELHGANGYLIDQFLQSSINQRTDRYGGSIANRHRFLLEIIDAMAAHVPLERVGVKISPNGNYNDTGSSDYRASFTELARSLSGCGLAYLHVVDGLAFGAHDFGPPMTLAVFRAVYAGTIIGNCGYTLSAANEAIGKGDADLIAFGRPYLSNPDLAERFARHWPLADPPSPKDWYGPGAEGYTNFPNYAASQSAIEPRG